MFATFKSDISTSMVCLYGYLCLVIYMALYAKIIIWWDYAPNFSMIIMAYTQLPTLGFVWIFLSWPSCPIICLAKMPYWSFCMLFQTFNIGPECHYPPKINFVGFKPFQTFNMGLKVKFSLGVFQKKKHPQRNSTAL